VAALDKEGAKQLLVGYYRTESDVLRLNDRDLLLARTCFPLSYHVFLVIQPSRLGPSSASFFFHEADGRMAELSLMEFPFEPSLLAGEERDRLRRSQLARHSVPVETPVPQRRPVRGRRIALAAAALVMLLALGGAIAVNLRVLREWVLAHVRLERTAPAAVSAAPAPPASLAAMSIGLHARRENGDVEIGWNRSSPVIAAAQSGVLSIQDGRAKRDLVLDATQVRNSSIFYAPLSEQISIQLAITTEVNTVIESVILFLPKNGPPAVSAPVQATAVRPLKPFTPPAGGPSGIKTAPEPALPVVEAAVANASALPALVAQPTLPPTPSPVPASGSSNGQPPVVTAHYTPPEPLRKVVPRFAAESLQTITRPLTVEVRVSIDKSGRVTQADAAPVRGANLSFLEKVLTAARQWTFKPARQGGEAVPSEFVVQFRIAR
jgi:hypothetical protein